MKSIFEIELHSSIIYKPPCSPSAAPCGPWESCCSLVASIASFILVLYLNSGRSFSGSEGQFTDTGSQGRSFIAKDVREFWSSQKRHKLRVL